MLQKQRIQYVFLHTYFSAFGANKRCQEPFAARGGELVCLVYLVYLVSLVCLVSFNKSIEVNQTN